MKSMKIAMAAIIVAALMVIPIALFTVDDNQSEAAPNYQQLTDLMTDVNWELLMGLDYTKVSMTNNPDQVPDKSVEGTYTVESYEFLKYNYKFADKAVMVVPSGKSVTICPTQGFSFGCASGWGTLTLKAGSSIVITSDGNAPTVANTIAEFPVQEDTSIAFQGRYAYDKGNWEFTFTIAKDSAFSNSAVAEQRAGQITFTAENKFVAKATINSGTDKTDVSASLKYEKIEYEIVSTEGGEAMKVKVNGNLDYNVNVVAPTSPSSSQKDLNGSIKGNSSITVDLAGVYDATVKNNSDINVKVENFVDTLDPQKSDDNVKSNLNGSMSVEYSTSKGMDNYRPEGSDQAVTLKDASASYKMNFNNQDVNAEVNFNIGKFQITNYSETGNSAQTIENLRVNGKYTGIIEMENANFPVLDAPASLSKAPSPKSIIDEYMKGVADKKSADDIKKYASEFFLGKFDQMTGMSSSGMTTKSLRAEVSIGKAAVSDYIIEGLNLNMEISESVGVKATGGFNKIVMNGGLATLVQVGKVTIGSTNVTVQTATDVDNKAMFDVEGSTSAEAKLYGGGTYRGGMYVKNVNAKGTIATENKLKSLTIGEYSYSVYGVNTTASNITMDVTKGTFTVSEMKISGNYYGDSMVKSVDGTYKNVTFSLGLMTFAPTVESVNLRIDDIDGDHVDFTRTFDKQTNVITNTFNVDGQMYIADFGSDSVIRGLMYAEITDSDDKTTEKNVFKGGVLVPGGFYSEPTSYPSVTITGKNATIDVGLYDYEVSAPMEFYISNSSAYFPYTYAGAFVLDNVTYDINLKGASLGVSMDADGKISYSLLALPGYTLSKDNMTYAGFTIGDCNDKTAKITLNDNETNISCTAIPVKYKLSIDGQEVKNDVEYGTAVNGDKLAKDVAYLADSNGDLVCSVDDGYWSFQYYFTKDVNLTTVKLSKVTTVETTKINNVAAEGATFTVPAGGSSLQFALSSNVRFDLADLVANDNINLVAQKTSFNGHDGFLIKAQRNNTYSLEATVYIPVSGEGQKLMHVDEYGRVTERAAETVTVGEQMYLKATTSDYSIFYTEADSSPVIDNGGSGGISPVLIIVGIVAVVAVIGVAVFFVKKN